MLSVGLLGMVTATVAQNAEKHFVDGWGRSGETGSADQADPAPPQPAKIHQKPHNPTQPGRARGVARVELPAPSSVWPTLQYYDGNDKLTTRFDFATSTSCPPPHRPSQSCPIFFDEWCSHHWRRRRLPASLCILSGLELMTQKLQRPCRRHPPQLCKLPRH